MHCKKVSGTCPRQSGPGRSQRTARKEAGVACSQLLPAKPQEQATPPRRRARAQPVVARRARVSCWTAFAVCTAAALTLGATIAPREDSKRAWRAARAARPASAALDT